MLDKPSFAERVYGLTAAHHVSVTGAGGGCGAPYDLHGAYLGEPTPSQIEREAEKPHAPVAAQVLGYGVYQPVHEEEGRGVWVRWRRASGVRPVGAVVMMTAVYISNAEVAAPPAA